MAIEFQCPQCSATIRVPDEASGKKGTCPGCSIKLLVPVVEIPSAQPSSPQPPAPQSANEPATAPPLHTPVIDTGMPPAGAPTDLSQPITGNAEPGGISSPPPATQAPGQELAGFGLPGELPAAGASEPPAFPPGTGTGVPTVSSTVRRRRRKKSSALWFPVLCGIALVVGVGWLWMPRANISGDRKAETFSAGSLPQKFVAASLADVAKPVRQTVLQRFADDAEWLRSSHAEVEFSATNDGLMIGLHAGRETRFVRFRIDQGLREWYDANGEALNADHKSALGKSLTEFFEAWDVAIRNQKGVDQFMRFRDTVALSACVYGLGYNVSARLDGRLYPCVYEDDNSLYFLLPKGTKSFQVVGFHSNGDRADFPGEYRVTIKAVQQPAE